MMKKLTTLFLIAAVAIAGSLFAPKSAEAVPSFARQMGVPCNACHFQYIPKLNSFGREFKLGGFTQTAQELMEDDGFSLPPVLNASFFSELEYHKTKQTTSGNPEVGAERGAWSLPGEAVIFFGGRIAENIGGIIEFGGEGPGGYRVVYSKDFGGVQGGLSVFATDAMGPGTGMELWNTGVQGHIQPGILMASRSATAAVITHVAEAATGFTLFASSDIVFAAVGMWGPAAFVEFDAAFEFASVYRVAVTPKIGEWDVMVGIFGTVGSATCGECAGMFDVPEDLQNMLDYGVITQAEYDAALAGFPGNPYAKADGLNEFKVDAMAINAQVQGDVGTMSLGVYLEYVPEITDDAGNLYTMGGMMAKHTAMSVQADLGITPTFGVGVAYLKQSMKPMGVTVEDTSTVLGFWYQIAQNIVLGLDYATYSEDQSGGLDSEYKLSVKIGL